MSKPTVAEVFPAPSLTWHLWPWVRFMLGLATVDCCDSLVPVQLVICRDCHRVPLARAAPRHIRRARFRGGDRALRCARLRGAFGVSGSWVVDDVTRFRVFPNEGSKPIVSWNWRTRPTSSSSFSISSSICGKRKGFYNNHFYKIRVCCIANK